MEQEDLQKYIYEHIPIVQKNLLEIKKDDAGSIYIRGYYKDHINHRNSVFGGSISTALILAAWANVRDLLLSQGITNGIIVIQSEEIKFLQLVNQDFIARIQSVTEDKKHKFTAMLNKFGKSRIKIEAVLTHENEQEILAHFLGDFVVVLNKDC